MKAPGLITLLGCLAIWPVTGAEAPLVGPSGKSVSETKFKNVGVEEFAKLRAENSNRVLDVRTPAEFAKGHLLGALNIDVNGQDFEKNIAALDKSKTYLVHCAGGFRSAKACEKMSHLEFRNLYNLQGGFKAWEKAGKPVEK